MAESTLQYALRPNARRRRAFRRAVLLLIILAVAITSWKWAWPLAANAMMVYHQTECLNYSAPPDEVVFDSDPKRVALLANDPNYVIFGGCAFRKSPRELTLLNGGNALSGSTPPAALLFLHERRAGGVSRLVHVTRIAAANKGADFSIGDDVNAWATNLATSKCPILSYGTITSTDIDENDPSTPHTNIRIYAGQPKPGNPSRFTIRYEVDGKTMVAEGFMTEDGSVDIEPDGLSTQNVMDEGTVD